MKKLAERCFIINLREWPRGHLFHFDEKSLSTTEHVVLLFDFPENRCHEKEQQEASVDEFE
jgi:hypothetical protein